MEPKITINGQELTEGQAMSVRVACAMLINDLAINGCGGDDIGKDITKGYQARLGEVMKLMANV